jgi:hypothetical protein
MPARTLYNGSPFTNGVAVSLLLAAMTIVLYWPVQSFDFVNYDDDVFVKDNRQIWDGLSKDGLVWAFTTFHGGNWHPLTWISHMADVESCGLDAGGHHRTNALIHTAGAVLLFLVLTGIRMRFGPVFSFATLFAIHPLHVESVAWVAERKDVLSGFFWILTMGAYAWYVRQPTVLRYLLVVLSFVMGLLSKPMVVTLPFVLLLLDFWPLKRLADWRTVFDRCMPRGGTGISNAVARLVIEKAPLFLLAAAFSAVTLLAQKRGRRHWSMDKMPFGTRVANALVSYMEYIRKDGVARRPRRPVPTCGNAPGLETGHRCVCYCLVQYPFWSSGKQRRCLSCSSAGCGTWVRLCRSSDRPSGFPGEADRYTYIPLIGLFIAFAWCVERLIARRPGFKRPVIDRASSCCSILMVLARSQVDTRKNTVTLFEQALAATDVNPMGSPENREFYLPSRMNCQKAAPHFLEANPDEGELAIPITAWGCVASRAIPPAGCAVFLPEGARNRSPIDTRSDRPRCLIREKR